MRIITILCLAPLIFSCAATAQGPGLDFHAGMQGLHYKLDAGKSDLQAGGGISVNYHFPITKHWQIVSGIGADYYRTNVSLNDGVYKSNEVDESASGFEYRVQTRGYEEKQRFFAVNIPAKLQYTASGKTPWYVNAGLKLVMPFSAKFDASATGLTQSGYYPDYNIEVEDMPQHGFGSASNWKGKGDQDLKTSLATTAGAGIQFSVIGQLSFSAGLYVDYGLTDMRKADQNTNILAYEPGKIQPTGVMNLASHARLLAYGLQVIIRTEK